MRLCLTVYLCVAVVGLDPVAAKLQYLKEAFSLPYFGIRMYKASVRLFVCFVFCSVFFVLFFGFCVDAFMRLENIIVYCA